MFIVWLALDGGLEEKLAICIALVHFIDFYLFCHLLFGYSSLTIVILCTRDFYFLLWRH